MQEGGRGTCSEVSARGTTDSAGRRRDRTAHAPPLPYVTALHVPFPSAFQVVRWRVDAQRVTGQVPIHAMENMIGENIRSACC